MAITMQGDWTIRVRHSNAAVAQRFTVSAASAGNGVYDGVVGNAVRVSGAQWSVQVEHRRNGRGWCDSAQRIGLPSVNDGLLRLEIASNDSGLEREQSGLVLVCSLPVSRSDHVIYGAVKTYTDACFFNPLRDDYIVIDPPFRLGAACARHPQLLGVIAKLYPEHLRARQYQQASSAFDRTPLVIPSGLPHVAVGLVFESRLPQAPLRRPMLAFGEGKNPVAAQLDIDEADAVSALHARVKRVPFKAAPLKAGAGRLARRELDAIAEIRDAAVRFRCKVAHAPDLLLRFQRYTRTCEERLHGPYTGTGTREDLGLAMTDEAGNYLFRFSTPMDGVAAEVGDDLAGGEALTAQRPDVIVQVLSATSLKPSFESAPYDNIANLRRIDLCLPHAHARPGLRELRSADLLAAEGRGCRRAASSTRSAQRT